jgi:hypothetical protein
LIRGKEHHAVKTPNYQITESRHRLVTFIYQSSTVSFQCECGEDKDSCMKQKNRLGACKVAVEKEVEKHKEGLPDDSITVLFCSKSVRFFCFNFYNLLNLRSVSTCVMTCDLTCDLTCDSVPASSFQRKGMRCHDEAGTESQVITHGHDACGHSPSDRTFNLRTAAPGFNVLPKLRTV